VRVSASRATFWVVTYAWPGLLPPIHPDGSADFKAGRTVPVTFALVGASGAVTDAPARLLYAEPSSHPCRHGVTAPFRYDAHTGKYLVLWRTKGLHPGGYLLKIDVGDRSRHVVRVTLRP